MRPHTTDSSAFMEVWIMKHYSPPGFEIRDTDTVIDIGAHIGFFSVMAASQARKGAVYSFEPDGRNFGMLQENIEINEIKNVVPINSAVAESNGERELFTSPDNLGAHSFYITSYEGTHYEGKELVKTTSLESVFKQYDIHQVDYLKLDCEGAEYEILCSSPPSLLHKISKMGIEYHFGGEKLDHFRQLLRDNGLIVKTVPVYPDFGMIYAIRA